MEDQGSAVNKALLPFFEKRPQDVEKTGDTSDDRPQRLKHKQSFTSTAVLLIGLSIALAFAMIMDVDFILMAAILVPVLATATLITIAMP